MTSGRVVIIGAGISGLTAAWWLRKAGVDVVVLEKEGAPGGTMQTRRDDGWMIETGPNSALETTPLFGEMFAELGIEEDRLYADPSSNVRYILRNGRLHSLPMDPFSFLKTNLWTTSGKLRLLKDPFIGRGVGEESVAQFVERRLGREFLDYAINPFVAGVYAGNPEELSVRNAFPKLYALEEKYGGLIKGMIKGGRERKKRTETAKDRAKMFSFKNGMQTFPNAIARSLGERIRLNCEVTLVTSDHEKENANLRFKVEFQSGGHSQSLFADWVVFSVPASQAAKLVRKYNVSTAETLDGIVYPPVAEVYLGYSRKQFPGSLDGFGYLIPAKEKRNILGTIWSSSLFPGRAPKDHVALTSFVGGMRQPELLQSDDKELVSLVNTEISQIMGVDGKPIYSSVIRWPRAIPQYNLGYQKVLDALEKFEKEHEGLLFCANFKGGIAVGDCVQSGERIARQIIDPIAV